MITANSVLEMMPNLRREISMNIFTGESVVKQYFARVIDNKHALVCADAVFKHGRYQKLIYIQRNNSFLTYY
jgi:hypothetical protein